MNGSSEEQKQMQTVNHLLPAHELSDSDNTNIRIFG